MEEQRTETYVAEDIPTGYLHPDFMIWQLETSDILDELTHLLRGEFREGDKWVRRGERLMNEEGIRMIVTIVGSHLTKDKVLTDLDEEDIKRIAKEVRDDVVDLLTLKWKEYEIDKAHLSIIVDIVDHFVYANLRRSKEGRTIDYLKPMIKRIETVKAEKEKGGFLSWIPFFR